MISKIQKGYKNYLIDTSLCYSLCAHVSYRSNPKVVESFFGSLSNSYTVVPFSCHLFCLEKNRGIQGINSLWQYMHTSSYHVREQEKPSILSNTLLKKLREHFNHVPDLDEQMISWEISSQTWIGASVSTWAVCDGPWQCQMHDTYVPICA